VGKGFALGPWETHSSNVGGDMLKYADVWEPFIVLWAFRNNKETKIFWLEVAFAFASNVYSRLESLL